MLHIRFLLSSFARTHVFGGEELSAVSLIDNGAYGTKLRWYWAYPAF